MFDIKDLDLDFLKKVIPNLVRIVPFVAFIYLFLKFQQRYLLWLSVVALFFLAFEINLYEILSPFIVNIVAKSKNKNVGGFRAIKFLAEDKSVLLAVVINFLLTIVSFIILLINSKDIVSWILIFSCILAGFHYITGVIIYIYVAIKYPRNIDSIGKYISSLNHSKRK
jgi:hypothetical protein